MTDNDFNRPPRHPFGPTTYLLDTNVLLYDPQSLFVFKEHDIIITLTVIEEIDRFKKDLNEVGRNARTISRMLDDMRKQGSLRDGIRLENGGRLTVEYVTHDPQMPITWGPDTNDNRILGCVKRIQQQLAPKRVVLVTRDTNMRLKCDALGLIGEDYENAHIDVDEAFTGVTDRVVSADLIDLIHSRGSLPLDAVPGLLPNQFAVLTAEGVAGKSAMVRHRPKVGLIEPVGRHREGVWGIFAKNKEQMFVLDLLLDDDVQLVTITGQAGTGKTLLALAAGLKQVADESRYRKLLVSRPIFPLGRDIGFLPGDIEQKLNPWMKPIFDNLELLISGRSDRRVREPEYQHLLDQKIIEVEPLTYIRGRSIPGQYLIVDEAQNLTPHEVKTVLTRAGEGAKIILTGDPNQIDHPYVDALSNGLTYTVERFKEASIAGHVSLRKGERSALAELAARLL